MNAKERLAEKQHILIPHDGSDILLFSAIGLLLATGYQRIEFGGRGAYVEIAPGQIQLANLRIIPDARSMRCFDEYRSSCAANVMVYLQRRIMAYADYRIGLYYIAPADLYDAGGKCIVGCQSSFGFDARTGAK